MQHIQKIYNDHMIKVHITYFLGNYGSLVSKKNGHTNVGDGCWRLQLGAQMCWWPIFDIDKVTNINYVSVTDILQLSPERYQYEVVTNIIVAENTTFNTVLNHWG